MHNIKHATNKKSKVHNNTHKLDNEIIKLLTFCKLKFAMGIYSGQKPRLGIWALVQARTESTRMIFPNMSDDDLPLRPVEAPIFIYIKQER